MSSSRKGYRTGTHRSCTPADTFERVAPGMEAMGITRIANVTGLDHLDIPVMMSCRPNARSLAVSQGKGLDLIAAKVSALMEALELFHAEEIDLPLRLATTKQLRSKRSIVEVDRLPRIATSQFHEDQELLWIAGRELMSHISIWVPYEMVHTNYSVPTLASSGSFVMSSNGLASGNQPLEAISHAICEVIERDAHTLWSLNQSQPRQRRVDLATIEDSDCRWVLDKFEQGDVAVAVWDVTSDIKVAAFRCQIIQRHPDPMRLLPQAVGIGCHPCREIALLRALTEAAQSRLTEIVGSRDDMRISRFDQTQNYDWHLRTLDELNSVHPSRRFDATPTFEGDTFVDDVNWQLERLHAVGIHQVVSVDLTKPAFGVPVFRIIIPGLEPLHDVPGYMPGRRAQQYLQTSGDVA